MQPKLSPFFGLVRNEIKHFATITSILEKLEFDRNLESIGQLFSDIMRQEVAFAKRGELKRTRKTVGQRAFDGRQKRTAEQHEDIPGEPQSDSC